MLCVRLKKRGLAGSLTLVCCARRCIAEAISIEPQTFNFGCIRVGHPARKTFTLFNQSDGVQRYHLDLIRLNNEGHPVTTPVDFVYKDTLEKMGGHDGKGAEYWVDEPQGSITPRSYKKLRLYMHPRFNQEYQCMLMCYNPTCTPLTSTARGGAVLAGTMSPHVPTPDRAAAALSFNAVADFPSITITDVHRNNFPKTVLWDLFQLSGVNTEMNDQLNEADLRCKAMEQVG